MKIRNINIVITLCIFIFSNANDINNVTNHDEIKFATTQSVAHDGNEQIKEDDSKIKINANIDQNNSTFNNNSELNIAESNKTESTNSTIDIWERLYNDELENEDELNQELIKEAEPVKSKHLPEESEGDNKALKEWEKKISDFEAAEMSTFELEGGAKELVFDQINEVPSYLKLAFLMNDEKSKINFQIVNPSKKTFYSIKEKSHLYYEFNATESGIYVFSFDNRKNTENKKITFAIHQGNSSDTHVSHEHINKVYKQISQIKKQVKKSKFTARLLSKKYDTHYEIVKKQNMSIVFFSLIETAMMILVFFFQLFYIKHLANKIIM